MKSIFQSKVFWVAVVQGLVGLIVAAETVVPLAGWILVAKSALDVWLRYNTVTQIN
jgi:uncharacterized membrane protein